MTERAETCGNCRWWRSFYEGSGEGTCRHGPPSVLPTKDRDGNPGWANLFPETNADVWCGSWRATKEAEEKAPPREGKVRFRLPRDPRIRNLGDPEPAAYVDLTPDETASLVLDLVPEATLISALRAHAERQRG